MRCLAKCLLLSCLFVTLPVLPAWAAPPAQTTDPLRLCRQGIELYQQGDMTAAFPLLERGFQHRNEISSPSAAALDELSSCAALLGELYEFRGELDLAATAYQVALEAAQVNANFNNEVTALLGLSNVSYKQADLPTALDLSQQALVAVRKTTTPEAEAEVQMQLGTVYNATGDLAAALESVAVALTLYQQEGDRIGEGTAFLFQGQVNHALGRLHHAFSAYSDALLILSDAEDPVGSVNALLAMAGFLIDVGEYDAAQTYLHRAQGLIDLLVDIAESFPGNQAVMLTVKGQHLLLQGKLYSYTAGFKQAVPTIQTAYEVFQDANNLQGQANALSNWGLAEKNLGQFEQALQHLTQAQNLYAQLGNPAGEIDAINHLGGLHRLLGQYDEAEAYYNQALTRARQVGSRLREGAVWNNLGLLFQSQGRLSAALAAYQQALAITKQGGNPESESATQLNLASLYQSQGRLELAFDALQQAQTIADQAAIVGVQATIHNSLGLIYLGRQQFPEALAAFDSASKIAKEIGDRELLATVLNNIGRLYFEQSDYDQAQSMFDRALTVVEQMSLPALQAAILRNLAMNATEQKDYAEAMKVIGQALALEPALTNPVERALSLAARGYAHRIQGEARDALASYTEAMDLLESVRLQAGSEAGRAEFIAQYQDLYNRVIDLYMQQGQVAQAFAISERGRARAFLDSLATDHIELSDQAAAAVLQAEREASARLQATREALAFIQARGATAAQMAEQKAQLAAVEQAYQTALAQIAQRDAALASLAPNRSAVLNLAQVQAQLDDQTTLISYWMLDDATLAFIVTADEFTLTELPDATAVQIAAALEDFYQLRNAANPHPRSLRNLHNWLIRPLAGYLNTSNVFIIPHQLLHYVPFAALTDGETYFSQEHVLSLLPSASVLPFLNDNARNGQFANNPTALVLGNPKTALEVLPSAEAEAQAVANLIGVNVYTGTQASELQLRILVTGTNILHLAAHGEYNLASPLYSAIVLAADAQYDGLLESHEIFNLPLTGNALVVLSACQTSLNELTDASLIAVSRGDELVGITRAFFFAGAPTVISSLWNVDDEATGTLMVSYYRHWLQEGMTKAAALQTAQADVRTDPRWASPFYWAGFVLNGHPGNRQAVTHQDDP